MNRQLPFQFSSLRDNEVTKLDREFDASYCLGNFPKQIYIKRKSIQIHSKFFENDFFEFFSLVFVMIKTGKISHFFRTQKIFNITASELQGSPKTVKTFNHILQKESRINFCQVNNNLIQISLNFIHTSENWCLIWMKCINAYYYFTMQIKLHKNFSMKIKFNNDSSNFDV